MSPALHLGALRRNRKAYPDVFNQLLQFLYEGCLSNTRGRPVDFTNNDLKYRFEGDREGLRQSVLRVLW